VLSSRQTRVNKGCLPEPNCEMFVCLARSTSGALLCWWLGTAHKSLLQVCSGARWQYRLWLPCAVRAGTKTLSLPYPYAGKLARLGFITPSIRVLGLTHRGCVSVSADLLPGGIYSPCYY